MKIFISHASPDKPFVMELLQRLALYGVAGWGDVREMSGGHELQATIDTEIDDSAGFVVVLSPHTINSPWVTHEVKRALERRKRNDGYKVIPLMLPGITYKGLPHWFENEPIGISLEIGPGELDEAMPHLLAALGLQRPVYIPQSALTPPAPLADLILQLEDPLILHEEGKTRAAATATLTYRSANPSEPPVVSRRYRFTAPLGPIETGELMWYLEQYWRWPTGLYRERAQRIEALLPQWGKLLYEELHKAVAQPPFAAWEAVAKGTNRRFTVQVDRELPEGTEASVQATADEAASLLFSLPWELLSDDRGYLFLGAYGVRVRRQLPNRKPQEPVTTRPPVRVLLVSPRPEDQSAGYLDHRASARPLVEAFASLGDLAHLTLLEPPTFPAMVEELRRATEAGTPYHVVHFDGHGVYDPTHGLGALCFENPADANKTHHRRSEIVDSERIAEAIRECRTPLVFLEACQSAMSEKDPTASVAGKLLEGGVASVVAMSHSVLVETARRFVAAFYGAIVHGERVGQAMLAGQRALKNDDMRGKSVDGELHLQDWFVPVLYQEEADPQLVAGIPTEPVRAQTEQERALRLGKLPPVPEQTFVGRSRELLAAERRLARQKYVVIQGTGGEGKTTLASELARWLVQTGRYSRAAFVPFDRLATADAMLSSLGNQLVPGFESKAGQGENQGWLEVKRVLSEQRTVIVLDNLESILPPPEGAPPTSVPFEPDLLEAILALCERLRSVGQTRLIFTSREALPDPFAQHTISLGRLSKWDAIELVAKTLGEGEQMPGTQDEHASEEEIERLVEAVGCHARSLVLISREVQRTGVRNASANLDRLMRSLHARHPDNRERSLLASVKLSLDRLPSDTRQRIRPLGVCQDGLSLTAMQVLLQIQDNETLYAIGQQLVEVGLAEEEAHGYLRFDPALAPTLRSELSEAEQEAARIAWVATMQAMAGFLRQQQFSDPHFALGLAAWELPNLLAALEHVAGTPEAAEVIQFATQIEALAQPLGRTQAVAQAERIRQAAARRMGEGDWSHAAFLAESAKIERLLDAGRVAEAMAASEHLVQRCEAAGEEAFPAAAYAIAMAQWYLGRARKRSGASEAALASLLEAERRFTVLAEGEEQGAVRMVSVAKTDRAECLINLGRLDEAARLYEQVIQESEHRGDPRQVAVGRGQLGMVYLDQRRYQEALQSYTQARETFQRLGEPGAVAVAWHMIGMVYQEMGAYADAERAYQESLQLKRAVGNLSGQASSLGQLGSLYDARERYEEAVRFYREAAAIYVALKDLAGEGRQRNNAAMSLIHLKRYNEARRELERAVICKAPYGHSAEPWNAFALLSDLERAVGNEAAARAARKRTIEAYRAYRRDGGESRDWGGQVVAWIAETLAAGQAETAAAQLTAWLNEEDMPEIRKPLLRALQQVVAGSRDPALADDPNLYFTDAVELGEYLTPNPPLRNGEGGELGYGRVLQVYLGTGEQTTERPVI